LPDLINCINQILNGQTSPFYWYTYELEVFVNQNDVEFRYLDHDSPTGYGDVVLTLPTRDFRDIIIEWKKFVEKPIE
jgi:hypothetical protein